MAIAQGSQRADPVTGSGVTTIGGIATNARVNVHGGPAGLFPVTGTLGFGTRVQKGLCIGGGSAEWCQIDAVDGSVSGYVRGRYLVEAANPPPRPPTGGSGGEPAFWVVHSLPAGSRLNIRRDPSASAPALATLRAGEIVRNLGCRQSGNTRWCQIRSTVGMDVTGWVAARYLHASTGPAVVQPPVVPPVGGGTDPHGPDFYVVTGLARGDLLNIRSQPSAQSTVLGRLSQGARVRNMGCQQRGQTRWCQIESTGGVVVSGWVNGRYLREG